MQAAPTQTLASNASGRQEATRASYSAHALQRDRDRYLLDRGRIRLDADELERLLVEAERAADKKTRSS